MIAALLQHDSVTHQAWLSFPRMPPLEVRTALKGTGWRYHGGHRSWHHPSAEPPLPQGLPIAHGADTPLSTFRPRNGPEILEVLRRAKAVIARAGTTTQPSEPAHDR